MLFRTSAVDPLVFATAAFVVFVMALFATLLPARRASGPDRLAAG
jgi:ABC-type lipoprotein release transport system permease subunit